MCSASSSPYLSLSPFFLDALRCYCFSLIYGRVQRTITHPLSECRDLFTQECSTFCRPAGLPACWPARLLACPPACTASLAVGFRTKKTMHTWTQAVTRLEVACGDNSLLTASCALHPIIVVMRRAGASVSVNGWVGDAQVRTGRRRLQPGGRALPDGSQGQAS